MRLLAAFGISLAVFLPSGWADVIHLKSGGTLEGVVLKKNEDGMVVLLKYATVTINSFEVESVDKGPAADPSKARRIADWQGCFQVLTAKPWAADLRLLPAPVMDGGDLKNVPYVIHASDNYQFVLFGDPDAPARVELGISGASLPLALSRKECVDLVAAFLHEPEDAEALRSLAQTGDKKERSGLVFEIDQEPDSRGRETWWVSVTDPRALDAARVSDRQIASLVSPEAPQSPRNPTLVEKAKGKGEPQEVITPFGTESDNSHQKRRRTYGGGGHWGGHVRWNHGHATSGMSPK